MQQSPIETQLDAQRERCLRDVNILLGFSIALVVVGWGTFGWGIIVGLWILTWCGIGRSHLTDLFSLRTSGCCSISNYHFSQYLSMISAAFVVLAGTVVSITGGIQYTAALRAFAALNIPFGAAVFVLFVRAVPRMETLREMVMRDPLSTGGTAMVQTVVVQPGYQGQQAYPVAVPVAQPMYNHNNAQALPPGYVHDPHAAPGYGYPPQQVGYPQQGYPPQAYPPQQAGYPPQAYPPQPYPPQAYPPQAYPPQAYPPQGYPPQGYPQQGYPPQGYPLQGPVVTAPPS